MGSAAIPDPIVLDVGLAIRSCHKSVIIKYINLKEKKQRKKTNKKKKTNEEKKYELTGLTRQT